jgi:hypothetical protein
VLASQDLERFGDQKDEALQPPQCQEIPEIPFENLYLFPLAPAVPGASR